MPTIKVGSKEMFSVGMAGKLPFPIVKDIAVWALICSYE